MEKEVKKIKKVTINDLATMVAKGFESVDKRFDGVEKDIAQVSTDLKSFKTETRENFDKLEKNLKENEESVGAVVADYHPHIIALEEKVFGSSTLDES